MQHDFTLETLHKEIKLIGMQTPCLKGVVQDSQRRGFTEADFIQAQFYLSQSQWTEFSISNVII